MQVIFGWQGKVIEKLEFENWEGRRSVGKPLFFRKNSGQILPHFLKQQKQAFRPLCIPIGG